MNHRPLRFVATLLICALTAFTVGFMAGERALLSQRSTRPPIVPSSGSTALAEENVLMRNARRQVVADIIAAKAENDQLRADESDPIRQDRIGVSPPVHEIQLSVQKNLGFIKVMRDRYRREHGIDPVSLDQLVGRHSNLKRLISADGEDYSSVSLRSAETLSVTTAGGLTVWYRDWESPDGNSPIDYPPNEAKFRDMERIQHGVITAATEAHRVANEGKDVEKDLQLVPFFATPQQAADYLELLDAMKAAGK